MRDNFPRTEMCKYPIAVKTPEINVLLTASTICFFPARSRLTHSLNSLTALEWLRLRLPDVTLLVHDGMTSDPGSGGRMNAVPGTTIE